MKVSIVHRENYKRVRGQWYERICRAPEEWSPIYEDIDFVYDDYLTLEQRTVEAIEELLEIAPEDNVTVHDGYGWDSWQSSEWRSAKSRLRDIADEWKGKMSEDSSCSVTG